MRIGHNGGPPLDMSWNAWAWRRAHADAWKSPGREIVALRLRRAVRLGLGYKDYTSVILDRGVHLAGLIIVIDGDVLANEAAVLKKLATLNDCAVMLCSIGCALPLRYALFATQAVETPDDHSAAVADAIQTLRKLSTLPPAQICMVGTRPDHAREAARAGLGLFVRAGAYFDVPL